MTIAASRATGRMLKMGIPLRVVKRRCALLGQDLRHPAARFIGPPEGAEAPAPVHEAPAPDEELPSTSTPLPVASVEELLPLVECMICTEPFVQPTTLDCGASFCTWCIQEHVRRRGPARAKCPHCREPIKQTRFRTNAVLQELVTKLAPETAARARPRMAAELAAARPPPRPPTGPPAPPAPPASFQELQRRFQDLQRVHGESGRTGLLAAIRRGRQEGTPLVPPPPAPPRHLVSPGRRSRMSPEAALAARRQPPPRPDLMADLQRGVPLRRVAQPRPAAAAPAGPDLLGDIRRGLPLRRAAPPFRRRNGVSFSAAYLSADGAPGDAATLEATLRRQYEAMEATIAASPSGAWPDDDDSWQESADGNPPRTTMEDSASDDDSWQEPEIQVAIEEDSGFDLFD